MSTGDLKNNIKKLQTQIKAVKYAAKLDLEGMKDGLPTAFLPLYHYIFTSYSNKLNQDISNSNNELYGKSDLRFIEAIYKILRDMFSYKPPVTRDQFFMPGFAERKVIMATEILCHVHSVYTPPSSSSSYKLASRMEKKHNIQTKVQDSNQNDNRLLSKPRKVASKTGPDLTEAIVLPRYMSSIHDRREIQAASQNVPTSSDIFDEDISRQVSPKPTPSNASVEHTDEMTKQFTEHITNTLTLLNNQVGKISTALQNVEDKIATTPRLQDTAQKPATSDSLQMETLLSKVILLENRMTILENKVDDIQSFCTILLETRNNNGSTEVKKQEVVSISDNDDRQMEEKEKVNTNRMHPDYVNAFAPVANTGANPLGGQHSQGDDKVDNNDDDDDVTIEDVVARDQGVQERNQESKTANMNFMKTLVGPFDSDTSLLRDQEDSSTLLQEFQSKAHLTSRMVQELTNKDTKTTEDNSFGNIFSPIRGQTDSSLVHFDDNSLIHIPVAGVEEDYESHRLSSTPNKADLDTSTLSRVNRIMLMMKETQVQLQN